LNIFLRSIDIAGAELTELRLKIDQPEVILRPAVPHIGFLDSVNIPDVIQLGEDVVEEALPELHEITGWRSRITRRMKNGWSKRQPVSWAPSQPGTEG
jgi:hypothetical protein